MRYITSLPKPNCLLSPDPLQTTITRTTTSVSLAPFIILSKTTKVEDAGIGIIPPALLFYYRLPQGKYLLLIQKPVD